MLLPNPRGETSIFHVTRTLELYYLLIHVPVSPAFSSHYLSSSVSWVPLITGYPKCQGSSVFVLKAPSSNGCRSFHLLPAAVSGVPSSTCPSNAGKEGLLLGPQHLHLPHSEVGWSQVSRPALPVG